MARIKEKTEMFSKELVTLVVAFATIAAVTTLSTSNTVRADILAKDDITDIPIGGNATTLGEIDVAISPYDGFLPPNGTLTLSTAGANDLDINAMPPAGMTIIIDNQSATVTTNPVTVDMGPPAPPAAAAAAADTSSSGDDDEGD